MTAKRAALTVHLWGGIIFGLFWTIQGLTGSALVFNRDIQTVMRTSHGSARLPLDTLLARASGVIGAKVTRLETFGPDPDLLLAYYGKGAKERVGVIDATSGALLERRDQNALLPSGGGGWGWLLRVHEALLMGDSGQWVVGTFGAFLLIGIGLGLWNALPYRRWRNSWRMARMRRTRQRLIGWHRLVGLAVAPPLLVMVMCGIYLAFAPQLRPMLASVVGYHMPYKPKATKADPVIGIDADQAYSIARRRFPGATLVRLILPSAKNPAYSFRLLQPNDERRWAGTSTIAIDPAAGRVLDAYDARNGPLANRITDILYSIHTGDVGGWTGRVFVLLLGLALPTFALTGCISWARRGA